MNDVYKDVFNFFILLLALYRGKKNDNNVPTHIQFYHWCTTVYCIWCTHNYSLFRKIKWKCMYNYYNNNKIVIIHCCWCRDSAEIWSTLAWRPRKKKKLHFRYVYRISCKKIFKKKKVGNCKGKPSFSRCAYDIETLLLYLSTYQIITVCMAWLL